MATRNVTDCDRCGKENISDSYRLNIKTAGNVTSRIDLDTKCLGAELQTLVNAMSFTEATEWLKKVARNKVVKDATEASSEAA